MKRFQHLGGTAVFPPFTSTGSRMNRLCTTLLAIGLGWPILAMPLPALARDVPAGAITDYAKAQEFKAMLSERVLQIEVRPEPAPYQDASLTPSRNGQGAVVMIEGRPVVVTSSFLVDGARQILIVKPDTRSRDGSIRPITELSNTGFSNDTVPATVLRLIPDAGLALLELPEDVGRTLKFKPLPPGGPLKPDRARAFWCVTPAGAGLMVLADTAVIESAGPPLEKLFLAPGTLLPGTVLFDGDGVVWAIGARESFSGSRFTLVAAVANALPAKPREPRADKPRPPAQPGVWVTVPADDQDEEDGSQP